MHSKLANAYMISTKQYSSTGVPNAQMLANFVWDKSHTFTMGFKIRLKYAGTCTFYLTFQTWHTAKDRCASKGGQLATIRCAEEAKIVGDLNVSTGMSIMITILHCTTLLKDGMNNFIETSLPQSERSRILNLKQCHPLSEDRRNTVKHYSIIPRKKILLQCSSSLIHEIQQECPQYRESIVLVLEKAISKFAVQSMETMMFF